MHTVIGWKSVLYQITKHRAKPMLSGHLPNSPSLFHSWVVKFWNKWASKKKNKQQKNQTKACKHAKHCNLCYYNVSRYNNPQRENKIGSLSFEGFHAKLECKLTCMDGNENQTANTHIVFIVSFSKKKKKRKKKLMMRIIAKLAELLEFLLIMTVLERLQSCWGSLQGMKLRLIQAPLQLHFSLLWQNPEN